MRDAHSEDWYGVMLKPRGGGCLLLSVILYVCMSIWQATAESAPVKHYTVQVVRTLPHNPQSFTQGLVYERGMLYESTGLYGQSSLQQIDAQTGLVQKIQPVPHVFAEGLGRWENRLIQLTWQEHTAFIYNMTDFTTLGTFYYETEGWGLTADQHTLIMSDGSEMLYFRNPFSFELERTLPVTLQGAPLRRLNELEYVQGGIYANVWHERDIVQIDPQNGQVVGIIDATPLFQYLPRLGSESVLNGLAYRPETKTWVMTGKNWPIMFEVTLVQEF